MRITKYPYKYYDSLKPSELITKTKAGNKIFKEYFREWSTTVTVSERAYPRKKPRLIVVKNEKTGKKEVKKSTSGRVVPLVSYFFHRFYDAGYLEKNWKKLPHPWKKKKRDRWTDAYLGKLEAYFDVCNIDFTKKEKSLLKLFFELPEMREEACKADDLLIGIKNVLIEYLILKKLLLIEGIDAFESGLTSYSAYGFIATYSDHKDKEEIFKATPYEIPQSLEQLIKRKKFKELMIQLDKLWGVFEKTTPHILKAISNELEFHRRSNTDYSKIQLERLKQSHQVIQSKKEFYLTHYLKFFPRELWQKLVKTLMPQYFITYLKEENMIE